MTRYETWEERDGATMRQRVGTDAPAGIQLVDADDYDELEAENKRLRDDLAYAEQLLADLCDGWGVHDIAMEFLSRHDTEEDA